MDFVENVAFNPERLNDSNHNLPVYNAEQEKQLALHYCMNPDSLEKIENKFSLVSSSLDKLQAGFPVNQSKVNKILFCEYTGSPMRMVHTRTFFHKHTKQGFPVLLIDPMAFSYLNHEEFTSILAHELAHVILGHEVHNHEYMLSFYLHDFISNFIQTTQSLLIQKAWVALGFGVDLNPAFSAATLALSYSLLAIVSAHLQQFELDADKLSVSLSGDPHAAITALRKFEQYPNIQEPLIEEATPRGIITSLYSFFTIHPDVNRRVEALCSMPSACENN